jgi:outer membrane immunogenic protein
MFKALIGAALVCALPTVAQAEPFSGPYVGLEGGVDNYELSAKGDAGAFDPSLAGVTLNADGLNANGLGGGAYAGYNFAFSRAFVGLEAFGRISDADFKATLSDGTDTYGLKVEPKETYGVSGRIGVLANATTGIYARGGWVNTRFRAALNDGTGWVSGHDTQSGVEYGAGIETLVGSNLAVRAEYVATDYGNADLGQGVSLDNGAFRAGVAFQF